MSASGGGVDPRRNETGGGIDHAPSVSVVICTRDRSDDLERAVRSILDVSTDTTELIVIDQTVDAGRGRPSWADDPRVRWLPSATTGLSRARNIGLAEARHEIVLMTDDDCTVRPDWMIEMAHVFARHPTAAAVFGTVDATPCDDATGFVPAGPIRRSRLIRSVSRYDPGEGIGACSGFRRSAVLGIGGFDELLGAGSQFRSGEEIDVALRLLLAGHHVAVSTRPSVLHHGFRTHDDARTLIRGYMLGSAACHGKLLRAGALAVSVTWFRTIWASLAPPTRSALAARRLPRIAGRIAALARGFAAGLRQPVDRTTLRFR